MVRLLALDSPQHFLDMRLSFLAVDVCVTTPLKALESMHTLAAVLDRRMFLLGPPLSAYSYSLFL